MVRVVVIALVLFNLLLAGFSASRGSSESQPAPEPPRVLPADLPTIQLFSEMEPPAAGTATGAQCFTIGPYETERGKDEVLSLLKNQAGSVNQRTTQALIELGYWVALPAVSTSGAAADAVRALRKAGIQDIGVVNNDAGEYRVSLGYFLDERNARRRRDSVRSLGFPAETRLQRDTQPRYWMDLSQPEGASPVNRALAGQVPPEKIRAIRCACPDCQPQPDPDSRLATTSGG